MRAQNKPTDIQVPEGKKNAAEIKPIPTVPASAQNFAPQPSSFEEKKEAKPEGEKRKTSAIKTKGEKGIFRFKGGDGKEYRMTLKEKKFCESYLKLQGNGTQAIIKAGYNVTNSRGDIGYNLAASMAKEYLTKPQIFGYITSLLSKFGYADENIEKQHLFLINQFGDLSAKSKGIDMYYKVKGKYPKDQIEISMISKYKSMSDDELKAAIEGEVIKDDE